MGKRKINPDPHGFVDDTNPPYDGEDDPADEEANEDDHFLNFVCGMMRDGQCSLTGTEECDWECPRSR
jgi:hypothetical protein